MHEDMLKGWDSIKRPVKAGYPPDDVQAFCVQDKEWQVTRLSMKGKPTHIKLKILEQWWDSHQPRYNHHAGPSDEVYNAHLRYIVEVQVGNYLGALRRGGQLDEHNNVKRYL